MKSNQTFGQVIDALKEGKMASRLGESFFIFRQVPSEVEFKYIEKMSSLPKQVKDELAIRKANIVYRNQFAKLHKNNTITSFNPTIEEVEATDWQIMEDAPVVASPETIGVAKEAK